MNDATVTRALIALTVLLFITHLVGPLFQRFRQPAAIGEIVGGILLGPTVLGWVAPSVHDWLFPSTGPVHAVLAGFFQLGLLLMMFCFGIEMRAAAAGRQDRLVGMIATVGITLPLAAGLAVIQVNDLHSHWGLAGNAQSFMLVFAISIAVTSIPVISRIMYDLGILGTPFARVVIGVAVIEDVALYVLLAVAVGLVADGDSTPFGLPEVLGLTPGTAPDVAYHVGATLLLLGTFLLIASVGGGARIGRWRGREVLRPVASQVLFLLLVTVLCLLLGVETFLGALVAGIVVGSGRRAGAAGTAATVASHEPIVAFSFVFFVPLYFGSVGVTLDLRRGFDPAFFVAFLAFAAAVKAASVYLGARMGGSPPRRAVDLALALNARGGPGIVLASVAYQAAIIDEGFYACLVLLAVITSLGAGAWLERRPREAFLAPEQVIRPVGKPARPIRPSRRTNPFGS